MLLARPLLEISKAQLVATLTKAKIALADDPTNRDKNFTRPRLRELMPALAAEGGDAKSLARLASRLARANAAVEILTDGAERYLALKAPAPRKMASMRSPSPRCPKKSASGCCGARSTGAAMRGRPSLARSKPCSRHWTGLLRNAGHG